MDPLSDLRLAITGPVCTVLAGVENGSLLATAMGHDGHRGWVYYVAVTPDARGRGHGRAMMGACEAWLLERNIPKLNLMLRSENAAVRSLYTALGYDQDDVVVYSRRLPPAC
jgi:hypothetical protein